MGSADLFTELLRHWRKIRGMSQLELGLAANVSARHISFLETGKAKPTKQSLLLLANALKVPRRDQNKLLRAASFDPIFEEPKLENMDGTPVGLAIDYMLQNHDPLPMVVMTPHYDLVKANQSAGQIIQKFVLKPELMEQSVNMLETIFHPDLCKPFVVDWEYSARQMLSRLHRETLEKPYDEKLRALLERLLRLAELPASWCYPNFSEECEPAAELSLERDGLRFSFFMTMTSFNAPQNITIEELKVESYFPVDDETERNCRLLVD